LPFCLFSPDVVALQEETAESHGLGGSPVDALAFFDCLLPACEDLLHLTVEGKVLGDGGDDLSDVLEHLQVDASLSAINEARSERGRAEEWRLC
jgi:hypothetical protein